MNHHDTYGVFPQGTRLSFHLPPEKRLSWFVSILPFLEQDNLWAAADKDQAWDAERNRLLATTRLRVLMCHANSEMHRSEGSEITGCIGLAMMGDASSA